MSRVADLVALLNWEPRADASMLPWASVEQRLGYTFPSDYKELMSAFGTGVFERAVGVICPARNENGFVREMADRLDYARNNEPLPHRLHPDQGGIIPWAEALDGWTLFWRTDRGGPDEWTIVYCDPEFTEWVEYDGNATSFLFDLLTGKIDNELTAEYETEDRPEFDPQPR